MTVSIIQPLPRLADAAVRATLAPPRRTLLACGLTMALVNGAFGALTALATGAADSTAGSMVLLSSMLLWLPVMFAVNALIYGMLAVHASHRVLLDEELSFSRTLLATLRPWTLLTLVLVAGVVVVASVFLLVPGILAALLLCLTVPVLVAEKRYLLEAMGRSASLIWSNPSGRFRTSGLVRAFALALVVMALSMLMTIIFQLPVQIVSQGMIFREALSGGEPSVQSLAVANWIALPFTLVSTIVTVAVYSYGFHAFALLYRDLVERREAPGLEKAIQSLTERGQTAIDSATGPGAP